MLILFILLCQGALFVKLMIKEKPIFLDLVLAEFFVDDGVCPSAHQSSFPPTRVLEKQSERRKKGIGPSDTL